MTTTQTIETEADRVQAIQDLVKLDITKPQMMVLYKIPKKRSVKANALYHMWKKVISKSLGYSVKAMHEILRVQFLGYENKEVNGVEYTIIRSTTEPGNEEEFSKMLTEMYQYYSEMKIILPHPDDQGRGFEEMHAYCKYSK